METTGIILAGGKSSRMGTNKALLQIDGKTVIERIAEELATIVDHVIVVTNTPEDYAFLQLPMIADRYIGKGPLAGIEAGLSLSATEKNLIVACDMPFISASLGSYLLSKLDDYQAAVPERDGQKHPLFAAYRREARNCAEMFLKEEKLAIRNMLNYIQTVYIRVESMKIPINELTLFNMNYPEEYKKAAQISSEGKEQP
ncbi:molybdenum cofactor guanylyltransferase [Bacillus mesophilum]|uniref:Probable molybdenum cofactor guanylyltransferase n=1 Tax=Bacillus mesophilum TaxID=1071718 RepID=A0A7V7RL30_9BACI|nr:molybdenum cofactor guanylyltransferase [Bacillus mesophilum]KAB2332444.1 molybdenum cofactor guanylyltransferase [Bacillus mesophilum]